MKLRSVLGLVVLAAIAAVVLLVEFSDRLDILKQSEPEQPEVVRGLAGSETMALLGNPEVVRILRDRHGITFEATQAGSVEMMTTMVSSGMDALLPSDPLAAGSSAAAEARSWRRRPSSTARSCSTPGIRWRRR